MQVLAFGAPKDMGELTYNPQKKEGVWGSRGS